MRNIGGLGSFFFSVRSSATQIRIQRGIASVLITSPLLQTMGPIHKISYDLSLVYRNFVVRSTYDSD